MHSFASPPTADAVLRRRIHPICQNPQALPWLCGADIHASVSVDGALEPVACTPARLGQSCLDESGLIEHALRRGVLQAHRRPEFRQPVNGGRDMAEFEHARRRNTSTRYVLSDAIPEFTSGVVQIVEVESAKDAAGFVHEGVVRTSSGVLILQPLSEFIVEVFEEIVTTVRDERREVRAIRQLELKHRLGVFTSQALQLWHLITVMIVAGAQFS